MCFFLEKKDLQEAAKIAIDFDDFLEQKIYYACIVFFVKKA